MKKTESREAVTSRPIVLLDVDGVVNKVRDLLDADGFQDFRESKAKGFRIVHSPQMAARLAALDADIHWLTTWCDDANAHIAPLLGWDPLPVVGKEQYLNVIHGWWKSDAAEAFVKEQGRPFIWLDDDLYSAERVGKVPWLAECELPNLCISPDTYRGLLPKHLDQIETWIAEQMAVAT